MNESLHLGVIRGIRLGINWTLLPIFLLIVWNLAETLLPFAAPGYSTWGYWVFAASTAAAFYPSLMAHELAHALVARRRGVDVSGIVLWLFGGVAQIEGDIPDPRAELEVAAAGPATSLGLAAAGVATAWLLAHVGASSLLVSSVQWLASVNALLALFNLLPVRAVDELRHEILPAEDFLLRPRESRIFYDGKYFDYPLKPGNALRNLRSLADTAAGPMSRRSRGQLHRGTHRHPGPERRRRSYPTTVTRCPSHAKRLAPAIHLQHSRPRGGPAKDDRL